MGRLIPLIFGVLFLSGCFLPQNKTPKNITEASSLVWVPEGHYRMGSGVKTLEQEIPGFWMQAYEVSYLQFSIFAEETGYQSLAERNGGSYVFFENGKSDSTTLPNAPWWHFVQDANWKNPNPATGYQPSDFEPVTHIAYVDACAYCEWLEMRLPTEAEWEYAAAINGEQADKNIWQGNFPYENKAEDGFAYTAPLGSFSAGKLGLYDMQGNVWEWCSDYYHANWYALAQQMPLAMRRVGPSLPFDESAPYDTMRVIRGGSYLCAENYCKGYETSTRMRSDVRMSFGHIGFRCVKEK